MREPDPELTGRPDPENPDSGAAEATDADVTSSTASTRADPTAPTSPTATDAASASATQTPRAGVLRFLGRHRLASSIVAGVAVFAILGTGSVMAGASNGGHSATPVTVNTQSATPTPEATAPPRAVPAAGAVASKLRTCSVAELATDARLGSFQGQVLNANTGEILFDRGGSIPSRTASVLKVLTSAAALNVLGPDYRATTTVVAGGEPGTIVLVGGGDLTLSRTSTGDESTYPGAAHLDSLADQAIAAYEANPANADQPITSLVLDSSYFGDPGWEGSWDRKELSDGYMPEITALQVDGDRDSPYRSTSARSDDPVGRAGEAFAELLPRSVSITRGTAPDGAAVLGTVQSAPVSTLIQQSLMVSDNAIAEMLGRLVAVESGAGNTFAAMGAATVAGLAPYGIDTTGIVIADGSGLSDNNAVPPSYLTQLFVKINAREGNLGVIYDGLPIAGESGSLSYSDRFSGANSVADGAVFAKTGWIDTGYTLAGVIHAADGTPLTFAVYALGDVDDSAKEAIDTLTAGFYTCGDNLSNN